MNDLEQMAIERLKAASEMSLANYGLPLIITDSGGKDVFNWWMEYDVLPGQVDILEEFYG